MAKRSMTCALTALLAATGIACREQAPKPVVYSYSTEIRFRDDAQSNAKVAADDLDLKFVDTSGKPVDLKQFRGKKNVVLVVTRGYSGSVCTYCSAQTSRLINNYPEFTRREAEVLVVFPGPGDHVQDFIKSAQSQAKNNPVPFPILLDDDFHAVDRLGIRSDLAKPSTYILDKQGQVRFAYVGTTISDRPSLKAILQQLDAIPKS
jgi:peroxiredoxin